MNNAHHCKKYFPECGAIFPCVRSQVTIKAIDNENMITLITKIFKKFSRSYRYRDNRQASTSLTSNRFNR